MTLYEEKAEQDKKVMQELHEELLLEKFEFYDTFISFVKKFQNETSRVHSAMGSVKSEKKASASRENGKKGGRPRKNSLA